MSLPTYRTAERKCYCRSCDKELVRNVDKGIFLHSFRNTGQNIVICTECVELMHMMLKESQNEQNLD